MINPRPTQRKPQPDIPRPRLFPVQRTKAMTICIAAICDGSESWMFYIDKPPQFIVGISDRMVSTKRTQSELPQPKFRNTVNSVMVQMSGVVDVTAEIFDRTNSYISKDFRGDPQVIPVEKIAGIYSQYLIKFLENRRDTICQARTGLRYQDFLKKHHDWPQALQEDIIDEINDEPGTQTIVAGIDESGAHIYLIDGRGSVSCKDSIGFAVIGSGSLHAHSQIMQSRHSPNASYYDTLFLIYMAKKQAELDRDVGKDTDIFVIKDDVNYDILSHETVKALGDIYESTYNKMFAEAKNKIAAYLEEDK
jgi:hypothetical protein